MASGRRPLPSPAGGASPSVLAAASQHATPPRRGYFASQPYRQFSHEDRGLLEQELPKWGCLIITDKAQRADDLRRNDPGLSELASYGMDVRVADSVCMVQERYSPFENRHVLAQVEILGVVETDLRPQGAVQGSGMACSVSHLRAMREAECRYGGQARHHL